MCDLFEILEAEPIVWIEKSRDMMASWRCVAFLTLNVMKVAQRTALFQTQTEKKLVTEISRFGGLAILRSHKPRLTHGCLFASGHHGPTVDTFEREWCSLVSVLSRA